MAAAAGLLTSLPGAAMGALSGDFYMSLPLSEDEARQRLERDLSLKVGKHRRQDDYPEHALRGGWTGTAMVRVVIDGAGVVQDVWLERTSGFAILDEQALIMVRRVSRLFVPFRLRGRHQEVSVPIGFYLSGRS